MKKFCFHAQQQMTLIKLQSVTHHYLRLLVTCSIAVFLKVYSTLYTSCTLSHFLCFSLTSYSRACCVFQTSQHALQQCPLVNKSKMNQTEAETCSQSHSQPHLGQIHVDMQVKWTQHTADAQTKSKTIIIQHKFKLYLDILYVYGLYVLQTLKNCRTCQIVLIKTPKTGSAQCFLVQFYLHLSRYTTLLLEAIFGDSHRTVWQCPLLKILAGLLHMLCFGCWFSHQVI